LKRRLPPERLSIVVPDLEDLVKTIPSWFPSRGIMDKNDAFHYAWWNHELRACPSYPVIGKYNSCAWDDFIRFLDDFIRLPGFDKYEGRITTSKLIEFLDDAKKIIESIGVSETDFVTQRELFAIVKECRKFDGGCTIDGEHDLLFRSIPICPQKMSEVFNKQNYELVKKLKTKGIEKLILALPYKWNWYDRNISSQKNTYIYPVSYMLGNKRIRGRLQEIETWDLLGGLRTVEDEMPVSYYLRARLLDNSVDREGQLNIESPFKFSCFVGAARDLLEIFKDYLKRFSEKQEN